VITMLGRSMVGKSRGMFGRKRRQLLFVCVGATCFLAQVTVLTALSALGVSRPLGNAFGFVISAQLNFLLSAKLTWRDRPGRTTRTLWARLLSYNATAAVSLAVNTAVFTVAYHQLGNLVAAALGVLCGMCVTYLVCDLLIFRERPRHASPARRRAAARSGQLVSASWPVARSGQKVTGRHRPSSVGWEQT
jgi:putative flippase GtrA